MARPADIERWKKGKEFWNAWADDMFARRRQLEESGHWQVDPQGNIQNAEAKEWVRQVSIDFAFHDFGETADFAGFVFPADITFAQAKFAFGAEFDDSVFLGRAWFDRAVFSRDAGFARSRWSGEASLKGTKFGGAAGFSDAIFERNLNSAGARFAGKANFQNARFAGDADFDGATFRERALFDAARFEASARFRACAFTDGALFTNGTFAASATFDGVRSIGPFSLVGADFAQVPDFTETDFSTAVRLDEIAIADAPLLAFTTSLNKSARYRALKRMASAGGDGDREMRFHASEMRARRGNEHLPFGRGAAGFWLGYLYQLISNFGRSVFRPMGLWIAMVPVFAMIYFQRFVGISGSGLPTPRAEGQIFWFERIFLYFKADSTGSLSCLFGSGRPLMEAVIVSLDKSTLSILLDASRVERAQACLYGLHQAQLGGATVPAEPYGLIWIGAVQTVLGAVLLVLCALAIRNRFKVR